MSSSSFLFDIDALPVFEGEKARAIDLQVTEKLGRVRVLEQVATRIADAIHYHLLPAAVAAAAAAPGSDTSVPRATTTTGASPVTVAKQQQQQQFLYQQPLLFVAGKGNNGANAIAAARILYLRGFTQVVIVPLALVSMSSSSVSATTYTNTTSRSNATNDQQQQQQLRPNMAEQLDLYRQFVGSESIIIHATNDVFQAIENFKGGILIDGILGTGIDKPPVGVSARAIEAIVKNASVVHNHADKQKQQHTQVLSIDMPSGLNHVTGRPAAGDASCSCVKATWTLNLHMLKRGQLTAEAAIYIGELWSAESGLGFVTFHDSSDDDKSDNDDSDLVVKKFQTLYAKSPITRVPHHRLAALPTPVSKEESSV